MKLRRLNDDGLVRMRAFLDSLVTPEPAEYPREILKDSATSDDLAVQITVDESKTFARRFEAAEYLYRQLAPLRSAGHQHLERDRGVWAWLALLWFDQLCPEDGQGRRKPGETARLIPMMYEARRYYRHLLLGPYLIYRAYDHNPQQVIPLLCERMHIGTSEIFRTIVETQQFITSPPVVELVGRLYYDRRHDRLLRGTGTKGAGGIRRLGDFLNQIDRTFDLHSIPSDYLVGMLPREFTASLPTENH